MEENVKDDVKAYIFKVFPQFNFKYTQVETAVTNYVQGNNKNNLLIIVC